MRRFFLAIDKQPEMLATLCILAMKAAIAPLAVHFALASARHAFLIGVLFALPLVMGCGHVVACMLRAGDE